MRYAVLLFCFVSSTSFAQSAGVEVRRLTIDHPRRDLGQGRVLMEVTTPTTADELNVKVRSGLELSRISFEGAAGAPTEEMCTGSDGCTVLVGPLVTLSMEFDLIPRPSRNPVEVIFSGPGVHESSVEFDLINALIDPELMLRADGPNIGGAETQAILQIHARPVEEVNDGFLEEVVANFQVTGDRATIAGPPTLMLARLNPQTIDPNTRDRFAGLQPFEPVNIQVDTSQCQPGGSTCRVELPAIRYGDAMRVQLPVVGCEPNIGIAANVSTLPPGEMQPVIKQVATTEFLDDGCDVEPDEVILVFDPGNGRLVRPGDEDVLALSATLLNNSTSSLVPGSVSWTTLGGDNQMQPPEETLDQLRIVIDENNDGAIGASDTVLGTWSSSLGSSNAMVNTPLAMPVIPPQTSVNLLIGVSIGTLGLTGSHVAPLGHNLEIPTTPSGSTALAICLAIAFALYAANRKQRIFAAIAVTFVLTVGCGSDTKSTRSVRVDVHSIVVNGKSIDTTGQPGAELTIEP